MKCSFTRFLFFRWIPFAKLRVGTLAVSNTTINYTKKLPAASATVTTAVGNSLVADGGALFIKLIKNGSGKEYLGDNDKVKVTLTDVTATFTGDKDAKENVNGQSQPYGIYIDKDRSEEKNLEVTGGVDNNFVRFNTVTQ